MRQEAEVHQRPDYYSTLFNPDGVQRERARMKRGLGVIASNPVWFASVMVRRAASMTRLERTRLISSSPAITHTVDSTRLQLVPGYDPLAECRTQNGLARLSPASDGLTVTLTANDSAYGKQLACGPFAASEGKDHVFGIPIRIDRGRMRVSVTAGGERAYVSDIIEPTETKSGEQPVRLLQLPFVSIDSSAEVLFSNEASSERPTVSIGDIRLQELGAARFYWTRYPRIVLRALQQVFVTAVFLPLALIGVSLTIFRKRTAALIILSAVPLYYFTVQSAFHTEYRYVLAVNYFMFAFAAVTIGWVGSFFRSKLISLSLWERVRVRA
jgi:hypothetical protein